MTSVLFDLRKWYKTKLTVDGLSAFKLARRKALITNFIYRDQTFRRI